jgi:hypothetical protein
MQPGEPVKRSTTGAVVLLTVAGALVVPTLSSASTPPASQPESSEPASGEPASSEPAGSFPAAVDLSDVCPATIIIQTDWFPESEYGATYNLIGPDYAVDADNKIVSGPLYSHGEPTGVDVEVRSGGPAIGADMEIVVYNDSDITFGYGTTDGQVLSWNNTPLLSVVAPLDISPQIIMWDPATYPDVNTLADLGTENVTINIFGGATFSEVFVGNGTWSADQVDPGYDGDPRRFIGEGGKIAQQGFASSEPYAYENIFTDWGKPVAYQLIHDAGFQVYPETFAIRPDDLESLTPCLERFVPVVQQSAVDFINDPTATNALIVDVVEQFDTFWEYPQEIADYSVQTQADLGLTGNGPDNVLGNMDEARVDEVLAQMRAAGLDVPDDLTSADLVTNEFIDPSIGL